MTFSELERTALQLDTSSRARLAERLLASLDELPAGELEALWLDEAERRDLALERGELEAMPADDVFRELNARFR